MPATSLIITCREMSNALGTGRARPLSPAITGFIKHQDDWWVSSAGSWLRITDTRLASRLDLAGARLDATGEETARRQSQQEKEEPS